jgi:hypothetical protein
MTADPGLIADNSWALADNFWALMECNAYHRLAFGLTGTQ